MDLWQWTQRMLSWGLLGSVLPHGYDQNMPPPCPLAQPGALGVVLGRRAPVAQWPGCPGETAAALQKDRATHSNNNRMNLTSSNQLKGKTDPPNSQPANQLTGRPTAKPKTQLFSALPTTKQRHGNTAVHNRPCWRCRTAGRISIRAYATNTMGIQPVMIICPTMGMRPSRRLTEQTLRFDQTKMENAHGFTDEQRPRSLLSWAPARTEKLLLQHQHQQLPRRTPVRLIRSHIGMPIWTCP